MESEGRTDETTQEQDASRGRGPVGVGGGEVSQETSQARQGAARAGPVLLLLAAIVISSAFAIAHLTAKGRRLLGAGPLYSEGETFERLDGQAVGSQDAKVQVLALLPLRMSCQADRVTYLEQVARAVPISVRVRFMDIRTKEGWAEAQRHGLDCAGVIVNGRNTFELDMPGGKQTVTLTGTPGQGYTLAQLRAVLQKQLVEAYGKKAPKLPQPQPPE